MYLTDLERDVLAGIYGSEYSDGGQQPNIWSWSIRAKVATKVQIPGVVSSLQTKGLVKCDGDGAESSIRVTEIGVRAAIAAGIYTPEPTS